MRMKNPFMSLTEDWPGTEDLLSLQRGRLMLEEIRRFACT